MVSVSRSKLQYFYTHVLQVYLSGMSVKGFNALMRQLASGSLLFISPFHCLTIVRYFRLVLDTVSSGSFYNTFVKLPDAQTPLSDYILNNPKLYPFLQHVLGALDGTHIHSFTSAADRHASRDRKGMITQNCLAVCSFSFQFLYIISGFEGSIADATMYMQSRLMDFTIPAGKFYLADAGFALCDTLLVPYRGVRYHLAEWGRANIRCVFILDNQK